jgi:DNA-binding XRE family transcriptional regulator
MAQRRKLVGCSQEHLADVLGVDRSTVVRWEAGQTAPSPWLRPKLARTLQISMEQLDDLLTDTTAHDHTAAPEAPAPVSVRTDLASDAVAAPHLALVLQDLDDRYDNEPSAALLADAGRCLGAIDLLQAQAVTSRARRELLTLEAEATAFLGLLIWDASLRRDHTTARAHFERSRAAAARLGHPAAEALAVLRLCFVALYGDKDPRTGLTLADHAAGLAQRSSPVLAGLAALHAAEAHALLGAAGDCQRALTEARQAWGRVSPDDPAAGWFAPTHYERMAGSCWLSLHRYRDAETALDTVVSQAPDASKARAVALGNLALARLGQHQLGEATQTLHQAIDVLDTTRGGGGLTVAFTAARALRTWNRDPRVAEVTDRLLTLIAG